MPALGRKRSPRGQVEPEPVGQVQPLAGNTSPAWPDSLTPRANPTDSRAWSPCRQPQPGQSLLGRWELDLDKCKQSAWKAKFEHASIAPSELQLHASDDSAAPGAWQELAKHLNRWLHREVDTKFHIIDQKLDLLQAQVTRHPFGRRSMNGKMRARPRFSGQSVASGFVSSFASPEQLLKHDVPSESDRKLPKQKSAVSLESSSPSEFQPDAMVRDPSASDQISESQQVRRRIESERYMAEIKKAIEKHQGRGHVAAQVWRFLENPYSSTLAHMYSIFVPAFVVMSVCISFLQTVKDGAISGFLAELLQLCCEILYAAELVVRFLVCPDRKGFWCNLFNWIDFVSALPIIVRLAVDSKQWEDNDHASEHWAHSVVVVVPLVRLLKLIRRFEKFHLLLSAFQIAFEALPVLLYTLMLIALVFSVIIYFCEPVENIGSLPGALWFIVVTMTTVGYGDKTPSTVEGYVVVTNLMIISSLYMAIPIGIVGSAFSEVWGKRDRLLLMHRMRDAFMQEGFTGESMAKIVGLFDDDGDGELDLDEFQMMLRTMHVNIGDERVVMLHESIDKDGGGTINVGELINSLFPKAYAEYTREYLDCVQHGITNNVLSFGHALHGIGNGIANYSPHFRPSRPPATDWGNDNGVSSADTEDPTARSEAEEPRRTCHTSAQTPVDGEGGKLTETGEQSVPTCVQSAPP